MPVPSSGCRARPGATETPAFLLGAETGAFLILAESHGFDFVGPEQPLLPENDPDEDDTNVFAFPDCFGAPHDPVRCQNFVGAIYAASPIEYRMWSR